MAILIAEDNRISLKLMDMNLQRNGYETYTAVNGKVALDLLEQHQDVDLVVTDIMMPEMDGLELLTSLKANADWQKIPVIMCTVLSDFEMIKKAYKMGCSHYITKPIVAGQLIEKVTEALEGNAAGEVETEKAKVADANQKGLDLLKNAILKALPVLEHHVVSTQSEDISSQLSDLYDAAFLFQIQPITELFDKITDKEDASELKGLYIDLLGEVKKVYQMFPAGSQPSSEGQEDFALLMKRIDQHSSDVIDALEELMAAQNKQGVRTIRVSDLELGMEAYDDIWSTSGRLIVVKGQKIDETVADRLVQFASKAAVVEPFRVIPNLTNQPTQETDISVEKNDEDGSTPIDFAVGLDAVDGDMAFLKELVHEFIEAFPEEMKTLKTLYQERNAEQLQRIAHGIKGSAGNLGMTTVFKLCYELEKMGSDSQFENMAPVFDTLENAVDSVSDFVDMYDW